MGVTTIALLAALLGAPAGAVPSETVLIFGRVRMAHGLHHEPSRIDSRRFEVNFKRRNGKTVGAQACLFADMMADQDWDGGCFPLTLLPGDESIAALAISAQEMTPVDRPAQRLLRMLAADAAAHLPPARRIIGFDPDVSFTVLSEKFSEADL